MVELHDKVDASVQFQVAIIQTDPRPIWKTLTGVTDLSLLEVDYTAVETFHQEFADEVKGSGISTTGHSSKQERQVDWEIDSKFHYWRRVCREYEVRTSSNGRSFSRIALASTRNSGWRTTLETDSPSKTRFSIIPFWALKLSWIERSHGKLDRHKHFN